MYSTNFIVVQVGDDFRICIQDDVLPSGLPVKSGSRVGVCNVAIGRDPFLWANPDSFDPERWMKYDDKGLAQPVRRVDEYVHPIFFAGRRLCLGKFCLSLFLYNKTDNVYVIRFHRQGHGSIRNNGVYEQAFLQVQDYCATQSKHADGGGTCHLPQGRALVHHRNSLRKRTSIQVNIFILATAQLPRKECRVSPSYL